MFNFFTKFLKKEKSVILPNEEYDYSNMSNFSAIIGNQNDFHNKLLISVKEEPTSNVKKYVFTYFSVIKDSHDVVYKYFIDNKDNTLPINIKLFDNKGNVYRNIMFETNAIYINNLVDLNVYSDQIKEIIITVTVPSSNITELI